MPGESNLTTLLQTMRPTLQRGPFAFCRAALPTFADLPPDLLRFAVGLFREAEGITVILPVAKAREFGFAVEDKEQWALITLEVHSDLNAVGFLATLTRRLADAGISVNAVSAYYHDHLFVPWHKREQAMDALSAGSETKRVPEPGRVLVVSHEEKRRGYITSQLRSRRYAVSEAVNGADALAAIKQTCPALIISDLMMPRMDGIDLFEIVRGNAALADVYFMLLLAPPNDVTIESNLCPHPGALDSAVYYYPSSTFMETVSSEVARLVPLNKPPVAQPRKG